MTEVLLFSDDEKIFNLTNSVIDGRYKLTWCTYKSLEKKLYPYPDIVIMYFDKEMVKSNAVFMVRAVIRHLSLILACTLGAR